MSSDSSPTLPPSADAGPDRVPQSWAWRLIKLVFVLLMVGLAGYQLVKHWHSVTQYDWQLNPFWLVASVIMHLITLWLFSAVWCQLISGFGYRVPVKYGFKISYITSLSRYVPGRIWPVFGMTYYARRLGIREQDSITSWAVAQLFAISVSFMVAGIGLLVRPDLMSSKLQTNLGIGVLTAAAVMLLGTIAITVVPSHTLAVLNLAMKMLRRRPITFRVSLGVSARVFFGYGLCWISYGLSFWMFTKAIAGGADLPIIPMATTFILAYQLGYLAIFTPGGVGVRELIIIEMLIPFLGPVGAGVAIAARFWNLAVEVLAFFIAVRLKMPGNSPAGRPTPQK